MEEIEQWKIVTGMTVAYCIECEENDSIKAYMDVISEWAMSPGWKRTIQCKRCGREVEQIRKTSWFLNSLEIIDDDDQIYDGHESDE